MAYNTFIPIVNDGLVFYIDAFNRKSYVNGDTVSNDLVTNDFGDYDLSWVSPLAWVTDTYENLVFISDDRNARQSIYDLTTDTSYKFSSDGLYTGGGIFDPTEIVNGLPVIYGGGGSVLDNTVVDFKRYEYLENNVWLNTFTKTITTSNFAGKSVDTFNQTNGRSDIWVKGSNNASTKYLRLYQWNGSDYNEYDFTSGISPFLTLGSKFVLSVTPVSFGRMFIQCFSYSNLATSRQSSIVDMLYTGGTYTDVANWTFTLIAGGNTNGFYGDNDGVLGVNQLANQAPSAENLYKGGTLNGEPVFYFHNVWGTNAGAAVGKSYIRKLFYNGSAWEVSTVFSQESTLNNFRSFAINSTSDKFYFNNNIEDELQSYDLNTSGLTSIVPSITSSIEQERAPKTIDLINGVRFDGKSWTFDGIDDYIDGTPLLPTIQNDTQGTIEAWVKVNTVTSGDFIRPIFSFSDASAQRTVNLGIQNTGQLRFYVQLTSGNEWTVGSVSLFEQGEWIHVVGVQDGIAPKVYINGELERTATVGTLSSWISSLGGNGDNIRIGCQNASGTGNRRFWDGDMSNIKYYNRGLSTEEVLQNYNALKYKHLSPNPDIIDFDAASFIVAHEKTTGVSMGNTQKQAIIGFVERLKGVGTTNGNDLWTEFKTRGTAIFPLCPINDSTATATAYEMELFTSSKKGEYVNFLPSDITVNGVDSGFGKYFKSGYLDSDFPERNGGGGVYTRIPYSGTSQRLLGLSTAADQSRYWLIPNGSNTANITVTTNSSNNATYPAEIKGFITFQRDGINMKGYLNGQPSNTGIQGNGPAVVGLEFYVHALNRLGGVDTNTAIANLSMYMLGLPVFTDSKAQDLYEAVDWYQKNIITGGRDV